MSASRPCGVTWARRRRRQPMALREVMVPQHHPLGDQAEVDFGSISFYLNGLLTEGWMFVMRLSASGKGFHRIYLRERSSPARRRTESGLEVRSARPAGQTHLHRATSPVHDVVQVWCGGVRGRWYFVTRGPLTCMFTSGR